MPGLRNLVRVLVGAVLGIALITGAVLPAPDDLPAIALGQAALYRLEIVMAVFYGCLLMVTPAYSGLAMGRLPIEISTRGARFAEGTDQSTEVNEELIWELQQSVDTAVEGLAEALIEIDLLKAEVTGRD
jgi:hypothetical protein